MKYVCKFRTDNARLPIKSERWRNIHVPRECRICQLYDGNEIGDEFQYIFNCTEIFVKQARQLNVSRYYNTNPNIHENQLLHVNTKNTSIRLNYHVES